MGETIMDIHEAIEKLKEGKIVYRYLFCTHRCEYEYAFYKMTLHSWKSAVEERKCIRVTVFKFSHEHLLQLIEKKVLLKSLDERCYGSSFSDNIAEMIDAEFFVLENEVQMPPKSTEDIGIKCDESEKEVYKFRMLNSTT